MPGALEIAGVVLGGIPIIVLALEAFFKTAKAVRRWRRSVKELRAFIHSLRTEQAKMQNILERLLRDIVSDALIEPMINNPFGASWKKPSTVDKIKRRLSKHYDLFTDSVQEMHETVEEIKAKLSIGPDGNIQWMEDHTLIKQMKCALFLLRRSEYQNLMRRLSDSVCNLECLVAGNMELEIARYSLRRRASRLFQDLPGDCLKTLRSVVAPRQSTGPGPVLCPTKSVHRLVTLRQTRSTPNLTMLRDMFKSQNIQIVLSSALDSPTIGSSSSWGSLALWKMMTLTAVLSTQCRTSGKRAAMKFALPTPQEADLVAGHTTAIDSTLMALGILLIEVALGQTIEKDGPLYRGLLTAGSDTDLQSEKALTLLERVNTLSSSSYYTLMRRCISQEMSHAHVEAVVPSPQKDVLVEIIVS